MPTTAMGVKVLIDTLSSGETGSKVQRFRGSGVQGLRVHRFYGFNLER